MPRAVAAGATFDSRWAPDCSCAIARLHARIVASLSSSALSRMPPCCPRKLASARHASLLAQVIATPISRTRTCVALTSSCNRAMPSVSRSAASRRSWRRVRVLLSWSKSSKFALTSRKFLIDASTWTIRSRHASRLSRTERSLSLITMTCSLSRVMEGSNMLTPGMFESCSACASCVSPGWSPSSAPVNAWSSMSKSGKPGRRSRRRLLEESENDTSLAHEVSSTHTLLYSVSRWSILRLAASRCSSSWSPDTSASVRTTSKSCASSNLARRAPRRLRSLPTSMDRSASSRSRSASM
mmetsp:Transcript_16625/g.52961  ORF Transcript_16625/g.52961 Transcript_16625/m.52961 type:complete len:298 (-) Transcript_16625:55-948(-)